MKEKIGEKAKMVLAGVGAVAALYCVVTAVFGERIVPAVSAQTDQYLSRRIDQLENRFYSIESRLNRLEFPTRPTTITPSITSWNDAEIRRLRSELDSLRSRVGETECGLLRVDERTLTATTRTARKRSTTGGTENCRLNPGAAIELSARP